MGSKKNPIGRAFVYSDLRRLVHPDQRYQYISLERFDKTGRYLLCYLMIYEKIRGGHYIRYTLGPDHKGSITVPVERRDGEWYVDWTMFDAMQADVVKVGHGPRSIQYQQYPYND